MPIVAGVDFGTLSVRVTLVDTDRGRLGFGKRAAKVYEELYELYRELYFGFGNSAAGPIAVGHILPKLRQIAAANRGNA